MPNPPPLKRADRKSAATSQKYQRLEAERVRLADRRDRLRVVHKDIASMILSRGTDARQSGGAARRWVITSAVAADLAGIWLTFANTTMLHSMKVAAFQYFTAGAIAGFVSGIIEQIVAARQANWAEQAYLNSILKTSGEAELTGDLAPPAVRYEAAWLIALITVDALPLVFFILGARTLLAVV